MWNMTFDVALSTAFVNKLEFFNLLKYKDYIVL